MECFAAGIVPYINIENQLFFLLGLERSNNVWSGFVGNSNKNETVPQTALREFNEETALIFEEYILYIKNTLIHSEPKMDTTTTGKKVYIYFIEFPMESQEKIKFFINCKENLTDRCYHEKSILRLFTIDEIKQSVKVYNKLKQLILSKFTIC